MRSTDTVHIRRILPLLALLLPAALPALESDRNQPVQIEADGVDINEGTGVSVYKGNVVLVQGTIHINADQVTVTRKSEKKDFLVAEGNPVTFEQQPDDKKSIVKGRAKRTEYDTGSELLTLIGEAKLVQGEDSFASERIVYDRAKAVVKAGAAAQGSGRVKITIQPQDKDTKGDGKKADAGKKP